MALGHAQKTPQLLDTLFELNELVRALSTSDLRDIINNIKKESEALQAEQANREKARIANEMSILALKNQTDEHDKAKRDLLAHIDLHNAAKQEADESARRLTHEKESLEKARNDLSKRSDEIDKKHQAAVDREIKALQIEKEAKALKSHYEQKLDYIKKIPV